MWDCTRHEHAIVSNYLSLSTFEVYYPAHAPLSSWIFQFRVKSGHKLYEAYREGGTVGTTKIHSSRSTEYSSESTFSFIVDAIKK